MKLISTEEVIQIICNIRPLVTATLEQYPRPDGSPRNQMHVVIILPNSADHEIISLPIIGLRENYKAPYDEVALAKAMLCKRTGMDCSRVLYDAVFPLETGDVIYQGGVYMDGLIVATSGGPAPVDEAISRTIALLIKAHCQIAVQALQKQAVEGGPWRVP